MDFSNWYQQLELETEDELWCISRDSTPDFSSSLFEWTSFLRRAAEIRGQKAPANRPRTTYAWHDEQACQLRFATANCCPNDLPFRCRVELQETPDSIVASWLRAADHIAWNHLEVADQDQSESPLESRTLRVWAIQTNGG